MNLQSIVEKVHKVNFNANNKAYFQHLQCCKSEIKDLQY